MVTRAGTCRPFESNDNKEDFFSKNILARKVCSVHTPWLAHGHIQTVSSLASEGRAGRALLVGVTGTNSPRPFHRAPRWPGLQSSCWCDDQSPPCPFVSNGLGSPLVTYGVCAHGRFSWEQCEHASTCMNVLSGRLSPHAHGQEEPGPGQTRGGTHRQTGTREPRPLCGWPCAGPRARLPVTYM